MAAVPLNGPSKTRFGSLSQVPPRLNRVRVETKASAVKEDCMSISNKIDQAERRAVIKGDQQSKLRPGDSSPSTMFELANLNVDTGVTPSRVGKDSYLSGSEEAVHQPAIPSGPWSSGWAQLPPEGPLNYAINDLEANGTPAEVAASIAALSATASSPVDVVAGIAEIVVPTLVAASPANAVEPISASSLISPQSADGASAKLETKTPEGVRDRAHQPTVRGSVSHPIPLNRPMRRL
jgi:hypothetical protein